ncbi:MAG: hypothetical protein AAFW84_03740 [Cyanobacteria bacterium J06635_15]
MSDDDSSQGSIPESDPELSQWSTENDAALTALIRAIQLSAGQFSLILAHCNYGDLRDRVIQHLSQRNDLGLTFLHLPPDVSSLLTTLKEVDPETLDAKEGSNNNPSALMVLGLEAVDQLQILLSTANRAREEFRKSFPFAMVLWVNDAILRQLIRRAPDLENWATPIHFTVTPPALLKLLQRTTDDVFARVMEAGAGRFVNAANLYPDGEEKQRINALEAALRELKLRQIQPEAALQASLEFVLGQDTWDQPETALAYYEHSLAIWPPDQNRSRQGCVLFYLGLWWRAQAVRHREQYTEACEQSLDYFRQAIGVFRSSDRFDLEARFINALAEVLQRLERWDELADVAKRGLTLHQQGVSLASLAAGQMDQSVRLAHDYGMMADVALSQQQWYVAQTHAEQALEILNQVNQAIANHAGPCPDASLDWARAYHRQQYHFSLARALLGMGQYHGAITQLEIAQHLGNPKYDPQLYIRISRQLQLLYYRQKRYLEAFQIRQIYRTVEQQYGLRAFIGAGRLQPHQVVQSPALAVPDQPDDIPPEIVASGRQPDVERLVHRMYRPDYKLTVIYGQSGVGKSSMIEAGLIPALQQQVIDSREVVPVLLQIYAHWVKQLGAQLAGASPHHGAASKNLLTLDTPEAILVQLQTNADQNQLTVLIFDQFEEFFAATANQPYHQQFYEFLGHCLALPYVKVVLALREDYIHHLLVCNRLVNLDIIDNNILDKAILYHIGNFTKPDARRLIQQLTRQAQFHLEPALVDRVVDDLAEASEEVRPIELQVLGNQLQTENITTLVQYETFANGDRSPKEVIVERYLDAVIKDCGPENRRAAELVLYWLTDEAETRPLRTKAELATNLESEAHRLDLVLKILVHSGIVLLLPAHPIERYQLVHDYLVTLIRRQRGAKLLQEIAILRQQEADNRSALVRQKRLLRNGGIVLAISLGVMSILGTLVSRIQTQNQLIELKLAASDALDLYEISQTEGLLAALEAAQTLRNLDATEQARVAPMALQQMLNQITQDHSFITDQNEILALSVSPDDTLLITADAEGFVKLWTMAGELKHTLPRQDGSIWGVEFSADGKSFAIAGTNGQVSHWDLNGKQMNQWSAHIDSGVASLAYHPNGDRWATAGADGSVKVWDTDGNLVTSWIASANGKSIANLSFSPDGDRLATADYDGKVRLWDIEGQLIYDFAHVEAVLSLSFHPQGNQLASVDQVGNIRLWDLDQGTLALEMGEGNQPLAAVHFTQDGKQLVVTGDLGIVQLWDIRGYKLTDLVGHQSWVWALDRRPNGQFISADISGKVQIWDVTDRAQARWSAYDAIAWSVNFSPDGQTLLTAGETGIATRWGLNGDRLTEYEGHGAVTIGDLDPQQNIYWAEFSADGNRVVTAGQDGTARVWALTGQELALLNHEEAVVNTATISPNGDSIATGDGLGDVRLWGINGELQQTLEAHSERVLSVRFSPDGQYLATASSDRTAQIWDLQTQKPIVQLEGHQDTVSWVAFSPDGQAVVTASHDGTARLWDLQGNLITELIGHSRRITWVGFSPKGNYIATASADNRVILWRYQGSQTHQMRQFTGYAGEVFSASFSPDEQTIAVSDSTGTITLWPIENLDILIERGCDWVRQFNAPQMSEHSGFSDVLAECSR